MMAVFSVLFLCGATPFLVAGLLISGLPWLKIAGGR
jgi:predicted branched-subunit amino acid permease